MKNVNVEHEDLEEVLGSMRMGEQGNIVNNAMHFMRVPGGCLFFNEYYGIEFVPMDGKKPKTEKPFELEKPKAGRPKGTK